MNKENCSHKWEMIDVQPTYIITEQCMQTNMIATYKSKENAPLDEYRDGEHYWNVVETAQSFDFNLKCTICGKVETFDELLGLMMCPWCEETCQVGDMFKELAPKKTWLYIAIGNLPVEDHKQLSEEKIKILEDYYNQRRRSSRSRIKIVSHNKVGNLSLCRAEVIKDVDMTSLTPPAQ